MDPAVQVAIVGAAAVVLSAWLARPAAAHTRRLKRIEGEFSTNGGSTAKDQLDRIETGVTHLRGRFDQHVQDSDADKRASHQEALRMWAALEAIANAAPPTEGDQQ